MGAHTHRGARAEADLGPSGEGTVVLDIGGAHGAAIVFAPADLSGQEIEIRPLGQAWDGTHTAIRPRDLRDAVAHAGVFGSLRAGRYQLRIRRNDPVLADGEPVLELEVVGGEVTQLTWTAALPDSQSSDS